MAGSAIKAGETFVEFFLEKTKMLRDLRSVEGQLKSVGKSVSNVGLKFAAVGAAAATALVPAVKVFASFEEQMSAVEAVTGATEAEMMKLEATARNLGATTAASAREAAEGMVFLGMAGFETGEIIDAIPSVLNLKLAGGPDLGLGQAADIASDVSSAFGLLAKDINRVSDVMAAASAASNTSIQQLGEGFQFAGPAGKAAGQEIEGVTAALGILANSGIKSSKAGRNLAIVLRQLSNVEVQRMLGEMGVAAADANGNFRDLEDVIADLKGPLELKSEVERVQFLTKAFGEGAKAAQILVESSDGLKSLRTDLDNAAGAAEKMAKIRSNNLLGDIRLLISAMSEAAITAIKPMSDELRGLVQSFTEVAGSVGQYLGENPGLISGMIAAAAAAGTLGAALTAVGVAAQVAAAGVGGLKLAMASLAKVGTFVMAAWSALSSVLAAISAAVLTPAAGTVALITAAVAALGFGLVKLQQHFSVFDPLIDVVKNVIEAIKHQLFPIVNSLVDLFANGIGPAVVEAGSALVSVFTPVVGLFKEFFSVIGSGLLDQFILSIKLAAGVLEGAFKLAIEVIKAELELLFALFDQALSMAEKAGIVTSRDERSRGKRLDDQLKALKERREEKRKNERDAENAAIEKDSKERGLMTPEEYKRRQEEKKKSGEEGTKIDPQAEKRAQEEKTLLDSLTSFAESVHDSNMTAQERFDATMTKLLQARAAGVLSDEDFNRASAKESTTLQEHFAEQEAERNRRLEEISNKNRDAMRDEIEARADLARSNGDFIGEMKALGHGATQAAQAGFNQLAADLAQQQLESLSARATGLEQQYQDSLIQADFTTGSAQEAVFGIGTETVDEQALEEAKAARAAAEKTNSFLKEIRDSLEE